MTIVYPRRIPSAPAILNTILSDLRVGSFSLVANTVAGCAIVPRVLRLLILRAAGLRVGLAQIRPGVTFTTRRVRIGNDSFVNRNCFFDSQAWISLGNRVHVGHQATFCTSTHALGAATCRAGPGRAMPITVSDGCWIGARAVLLPGVVVGEGCVVASGAVVTDDCAPNGLYAGVPARRVRDLV